MKKFRYNNTTNQLNIVATICYLLSVLIFNYTIQSDLNWGDAFSIFSKETLNIDYLSYRYHYWSSRLIVDALLVPLSKHQTLFFIINTTVMGYLPFAIKKLFPTHQFIETHFWLIILLISLYPIKHMQSAGWIATFMNYYYPLTAGLIALQLIFTDTKKTTFPHKLGLYTALLFAANTEQACLLLLIIFSYQVIISMVKKEFVNSYFWGWLISLLSIIFIITTPGNTHRIISETYTWVPDFINYPFIYKAYLGFQSTINYYFFQYNPITMVLIGVLALNHYLKKPKKLIIIVYSVLLLPQIITLNIGYIERVTNSNLLIDTIKYLYLALSILLFLALLSRILDTATKKQGKIIAGIILIGFLIRFAIGFSPTLFASGTRTFIFTDFSLIIGMLLLINDNKNIQKYIIKFESLMGKYIIPYFRNNFN